MAPPTTSPPPTPSLGRRLLRVLVRFTRVSLLVLLIVLGAAVIYLHEVGLPAGAKERIIAAARDKGWELDFSRIRLQGWHSIVADDIQLQPTGAPPHPALFIAQARCVLDISGLKLSQVRIDSVALTGGRLLVPHSKTNLYGRNLILNDLDGELQLAREDRCELRFLRGVLHGMKFYLSGELAHPSALTAREKSIPKASGTKGSWNSVVDVISEIQLTGAPELAARFQADAQNWKTFKANLTFNVPGVRSPWAVATNLVVSADVSPATKSNGLFHAKLDLRADSARTPWAQSAKTRLNVDFEPSENYRFSRDSHITFESVTPNTPWGSADAVKGTLKFTPAPEQLDGSTAEVYLALRKPRSRWVTMGGSEITARLALPPPAEWKLGQTNLDWVARLQNVPCDATIRASNVVSGPYKAERLAVQTGWQWPQLSLTTTGQLYRGQLALSSRLNATNREVFFETSSGLDVWALSSFLPTNVQMVLADYAGDTTPNLQARGRLVLPPWTNGFAGWPQEILPTLTFSGRSELAAGAYRGAEFRSFEADLGYTNRVISVPAFRIARTEGNFEGDLSADLASSKFASHFSSQVDLMLGRGFSSNAVAQKVFNMFAFSNAPSVRGEIRGSWRDFSKLYAKAEVGVTNVVFRDQPVEWAVGTVQYTNKLLSIFNPALQRAEGQGRANLVEIDFGTLLLRLVNANGRIDPMALARAIGPPVVRALQPYRFESAPEGVVNGVIDLKRRSYREDMHFRIRGGPMHWDRFNFAKIEGDIDWVGKTLVLTNVQGDFQSGRADGHARFDFTPKVGADFSFKATFVEADLHELLSRWTTGTNSIEGRLNGELSITSGNTGVPQSCQGYGWVSLRDGLLWDIPMFGVFSPILNAFMPGLGNSRARKASATFLITNSIISTSDLEIDATAMRMQFEGTATFEGEVDFRVVAELLRNVPAVGLVISKVLWPVTKIFEYKVTGKMQNPKAEPVYLLPKLLAVPFYPFKTLKHLIQDKPEPPPADIPKPE